MEKMITKKAIVVMLILFTLVLSSFAQVASIEGFSSGWANQTFNSGTPDQVYMFHSGASVSSGTVNCFGSSAGRYSVRPDANLDYFEVQLNYGGTTKLIDQVSFNVTANGTTTGYIGNYGWSTDGTTWTNGAQFSLPTTSEECALYTVAAPSGNYKYFRIMRNSASVTWAGTLGGGQTIRIYSMRVWTKSTCTPATTYSVNGTTTITSGNSTNVTLSGSQTGVDYQLYKGGVAEGGPKAGTGEALTWSVSPTATSTYTVKSVGTATYCETAMTGSAVITVKQNVPLIELTSASGTNAQTPTVNTAITSITYSLAGGTATTANVTWTGTSDANTPPAGISVNFSYPTLTISGTPTVIGNYGYTATTDGDPAAQATGTINVSRYTLNDYVSVANGNWNVLANWKQWNGSVLIDASAFPNANTVNVYIANGTEINVETNGRSVKNLTVEGTLTSSGSYNSLMYLNIYGDLTVNTGGFIGDVNNTSGDGYDGISLNIYGTNSKITGNGGNIYLGRLRTNLAGQTLTIDHDLTAIYYGATNQGGHTVSVYPNGVDNTTITINPGKTLTLAPWSVLGTTASSNGLPSFNFTVNVNGTLDVQDTPYPNAQTPSTIRSMIYGGTATDKTFTLNIGSTGIVNVPQFYPNGTVSGGGIPTGSTSVVNIASGGVLNVSQMLDLRQVNQTITGSGTLNLQSGATLRIGNTAGVNGQILSTSPNLSTAANYQFEGTTGQVTGSLMPSTVNNLLINNTAGVTMSAATAVSGTLTVNAGSTLKNGGYTLTNNGTANINGAFQIDEGGWATGNNFVYGTAGSLIFNNSTGPYGVSGSPAYWPATAGPVNVTVQNTGGLELQVPRTVSGIFQTAAGVKNTFSNDLTITGTVRLNANGYFDNFAPTYSGTGSTLEYNTGGTYGVYNEWGSGSVVGYGVPQNVTVNNATTVNLSGSRNIPGNLALTSGTVATGSNTLTLAGAISGTGTINSGTTGTLTFAGTAEQTLDAANLTSGAVNNLVINAGSKLTTTGSITAAVINILSNETHGTGTLVNNGTLTNTNASVQQYLKDARNWYVSSPVSKASAPENFTYYSYKENQTGIDPNAYWVSVSPGDDLNKGVGYIALPSGTGSTITFATKTGETLNSGDVDIALTRAGTIKTGFNLIGNPYPSHLTWTKTFVDNNALLIEPTIWYRTNAGITNNSHQWSYPTINASTGEAVPAGTSNIIPPMQGFWVRALSTGTLTLNSDLTRSHQTANLLKAPAVRNNERQRLRLQVNNGTITDEALIYFDASASDGFDRYDSPKFMETNTAATQIYTTAGNQKLVINGMNSITPDQKIDLGFVPGDATSFSIRANEVSNLPAGVKVILKDNAKDGTETDLTDGVTVYEFAPATTTGDRFSLILRSPGTVTGLENGNTANITVFANANRQIVVNAAEGMFVNVYNATGQRIASQNTNGTALKISVPVSGAYMVNVSGKTFKVVAH